MQKFPEIQYVRPDLAAFREEAKAHVENIRNARSYEELKAEMLRYDELQKKVMTMRSVASIRNTVNTLDAFYDEEIRYFNREFPSIMLIGMKADEALLASPFIGEFEKEFGSILIQNMKNSLRFADERLVPMQIRESELTRRYSRASANAAIEFRGEKCNFYGLLKYMNPKTEKREKKRS